MSADGLHRAPVRKPEFSLVTPCTHSLCPVVALLEDPAGPADPSRGVAAAFLLLTPCLLPRRGAAPQPGPRPVPDTATPSALSTGRGHKALLRG